MKVSWRTKHYGKSECKQSHLRGGMSLSILLAEEAWLKGYTAHKADGTIITGTAFAGYPNEFVFLDNIEDSSGNPIKDSSGKTIQGQTIYRKARNSVLLDSTGDIIEDGFEQ